MAGDTKGTLDRYPLPRLLCFLEQKSFTGVLRIEDSGITREVLVNAGIPVALYPQTIQALTRQFLEWGRLDTEQYARLMNELTAAGAQEEQLLAQVAGVTPEELSKGRRYLLFRDLCRLFALPDAPFVLSTQPDPRIQQHAQQAAIEPLYLVYNGIRNSYDEQRLRDELGALDGHAIRLKPGSDTLLPRFGFGQEEAAVLQFLQHGYWTLADLITAAETEPLPTLMVVYALWCASGIDAAPQDSVTRLRPRQRPTRHSSQPTLDTVGTEADLLGDGEPSGRTNVAQIRLQPNEAREPSQAAAPQAPAGPTPPPQAEPDEPQPPVDPKDRFAIPEVKAKPKVDPRETGSVPRRLRAPTTNRSGTFTAAKVPDMVLRKARLAATRLKGEGNLKEEAIEVLDELLDRLDALDGQSPFQQLGVNLDVKSVDVKRAYMQLVKRLHPDRLAAMGLEELAEPADALFKRLTQSHQTLSDPDNLAEAKRIFSGEASAEDPEEARRAIEAEVNFQKGEVFFRKGDLTQAESYFRLAVEGNPQEGEHLALLGWTVYQSLPREDRPSRREDVLKMIKRALELSPRCARGHYYMGKLHLDANNKDTAMSYFRKATNIRENYIDAMRELRLLTMRRQRDTEPKKRSTLLDMIGLGKKKKKK